MIKTEEFIKKNNIKVAVVGNFKKDSTNIPLADGLSSLPEINSVYKYDYKDALKEKNTTLIIRDFGKLASNYDLILICKGSKIPSEAIRAVNKINKAKLYLWFMDWYPQLISNDDILQYSRFCHFRSATGYETARKWSSNINLPVEYILDGYDPKIFYPKKQNKIWDICFIGGSDGERKSIHKFLQSKGYNVRFEGPKFTQHKSLQQVKEIMDKSKIVLNISRGSLEGYSSVRLWYCLGNGSFVLSKTIPNMDKRMGIRNGEHLDSFSSLIELDEKARYYLSNDHIRESISNNAERYVFNSRTWNHVAKEILERVLTKKYTYFKL